MQKINLFNYLTIMKKLSLFVLFIAATFTSCSSDDDSTSGISEANLIGTWQWSAAEEDGVAETLDQCDLQDTYEFTTAGKVISNFSSSSTDGSGVVTCVNPGSEEFGWSLSGDQLTFAFGTETETATILTLNSTTLKVEFRDEETPGEITVYTETYTRL